MKPIGELIRALAQPDVAELAMATSRPPCVKVGGAYKPLEPNPATTAEILAALTPLVGAQNIDGLSDKPAQWTANVAGIGQVGITAVKRGDTIQARLMITARATAAAPAPAAAAKAPATPVAAAPKPAPAPAAPAPSAAPAPDAAPVAAAAPAAAPLSGPVTDLAMLLSESRRLNASDLHVVAGRPPLFRIGGDVTPRGDVLDAATVERIVMERIPDRPRAVLEKDGSCDFALDDPTSGRFRVNVGRQRTGLKASLRLIGKDVPTLASLGLPGDIGKATHHHQGLIVVTGPSGHGKTSTMTAIVDIINSNTTHHIITVEDPIEYLHPRKKAVMSQREVGTHTKTFQAALKGSLREDPDVIVVGELRDTETVRMALSAAETGHLVISTMNTPSAAKTIDRLIDLFPPSDQPQVRMSLSTGLRLVVSQRLLPNSDRSGIVVAAEVLPGSPALGALIRDNKTFQIPSLQQRGKSLGIVRLDDSLAELVAAGKTSLEIAKEYAETPGDLEAAVKAKNTPPAPDPAAGKPAGGLASRMGSLVGRKGG